MQRTSHTAAFLTLLGMAACQQSSEWKISPDPEVVNFPLEDAERVSQDLVDPPFLPVHEQVAGGPPRIVEIRMEIIEQEVEIAPGVFV